MKPSGLPSETQTRVSEADAHPGCWELLAQARAKKSSTIFSKSYCLPVTPPLTGKTKDGAAVGSQITLSLRQLGRRACHALRYPDLLALPRPKL